MRPGVAILAILPLLATGRQVSDPSFRVDELRAVFFDESRGEWGDTNFLADPRRPLWNRIPAAILLTVHVSGPELHRQNRERLKLVVRGNRIDLLDEYPLAEFTRGLNGWIPVVIYPQGCTPVSFEASIIGRDGMAGPTTRDSLAFACGE
jgi:hypothetical protein